MTSLKAGLLLCCIFTLKLNVAFIGTKFNCSNKQINELNCNATKLEEEFFWERSGTDTAGLSEKKMSVRLKQNGFIMEAETVAEIKQKKISIYLFYRWSLCRETNHILIIKMKKKHNCRTPCNFNATHKYKILCQQSAKSCYFSCNICLNQLIRWMLSLLSWSQSTHKQNKHFLSTTALYTNFVFFFNLAVISNIILPYCLFLL